MIAISLRAARTAASGAALIVALASVGASAQEASDPGWAQFQGTAAHTGAGDGPAPPYRRVWELPLEAGRDDRVAGPVVWADAGVVVTPVSVVAFEVSTGEERWSVERDGASGSPAIVEAGGAPVVVYADGTDADTAALVAVALEDGSPVWERPLEAEPAGGVTSDEGRAFVADDDGTVYGVDVQDGAVAWTNRVSGTVLGPPAASDGRIFVVGAASEGGASARIVALDAGTGEPLWPAVTPDAASSFGSLAVVEGDEVLLALQDGVVYALSADDGSISWSERIAAPVSPLSAPAVTNGGVVILDRTAGVHRVTPAGRTWLFEFNETVVAQSPVVLGDVVVVGFEDGGVGAVDLSNGRMVFRAPSTGVPVAGIAPAGDLLVVAHGGSGAPRVVGLTTDPDGALVDVASPTEVDGAALASGFVIAFALVAVLCLGAARTMRSRYEVRDPSREDAADPGGDPG